jgi:uncharacterized C2H2 Zn-finger protein
MAGLYCIDHLCQNSLSGKICGKAFNTSANLGNHQQRVHQATKNFKCPDCEKLFKTNSDLKQHSVSHSEARNFECLECGKLFRTNSELQQHQKTHSKNRNNQGEIVVIKKSYTLSKKSLGTPSEIRRKIMISP